MKDYQSYIDAAVEQFRTLITQQLDRELKMEEGATAKDFTKLEKIKIGVIGGDGIGPIIVSEASRLMQFLLADEIKAGKIEIVDIPGLTIERR